MKNEIDNDKRSFYAILPACVRYDKELSSTSKLLYAEITALCNERGYCWATNKYFTNLFGVSDRQVQRILKQLLDKKYIYVLIERQKYRRIYIINPDKNVAVSTTKMSGNYDKNVAHNIINNNKKEYEKDNFIPLFDYDWLNHMDQDN